MAHIVHWLRVGWMVAFRDQPSSRSAEIVSGLALSRTSGSVEVGSPAQALMAMVVKSVVMVPSGMVWSKPFPGWGSSCVLCLSGLQRLVTATLSRSFYPGYTHTSDCDHVGVLATNEACSSALLVRCMEPSC